jgi:hypothetical protein
MSVANTTDKYYIDPEIKAHPDLNAAVDAANTFLEEKWANAGPPECVRWVARKPGGKLDLVQLEMYDAQRNSDPDASRPIWTRWLLDPVSREIAVLQVWGDLLAKRVDKNEARINNLLNHLRTEGTDGSDHDE